MQPVKSPPPLAPAVNQDVFRPHDKTQSGKPDIAPDGTAALEELRSQIATGTHEERELALDILVNLAAGEDDQGKAAQQTLREVYAKPDCADAQRNTAARRHIENLSLALCRLALDPPPNKGSKPELFDGKDKVGRDNLSMTVAYLGGRSQEPPGGDNGGTMQAAIERHIGNRLSALGDGARPWDKEQYLGAGRSTQLAELHAACKGLKHLKVHPETLNMQCSTPGAAQQQFVQPLQDMIADMKKSGESCRAALINTGHNEFAHWMTLVVQVEGDHVTFHVVDTDKSACEERDILKTLGQLLDVTDSDAKQVIQASDVQKREVCAQACGVLGYGLLQALDGQMGKGAAIDVQKSIGLHLRELEGLPDDDLGARVVADRARLLDGWAGGANLAPLPADREDVLEFLMASSPAPVSAQAQRVTSTPAADKLAGLADKMRLGVSSAPGGGYVSSLGAMCASLNTLRALGDAPAGATGKDPLDPQRMRQRQVNQEQFCKAQPESLQPVLQASLRLDRTVGALQANGGSPLIHGKNFEQTPQLAEKVAKLQLNAGSWIQKVTGLELQMKTLMGYAEGAASPDKDKAATEFMRFQQLLAEIGQTIEGRVKSLEEDLKALNEILDHGEDWFDGRGAYGIGHSQVQADARQLRDALAPWLAALTNPAGEVHQLATFAREAAQHPHEAIKAIQARVPPPLHMLA